VTPASSGRWIDDVRAIGPGLVIAATGVGAGDLIAATVSGSRYGFALVWAAVVGASLKLALNEGLARWQLATGTTLLEGWVRHLGRWVQYVFLLYLAVWSFIVAGALINACGLAAHALAPALSVEVWGALHSLVAAAFVLVGRYRSFERVIGLFVGVMFVTLVGSALFVAPPVDSLASMIREAGIPTGSPRYLLSVIGGVGGSVTLLSYGYWIREKGWEGAGRLRRVRVDLSVAYMLTGIFGVSVMVLAAHVLHGSGTAIAGAGGVLQMSAMLGQVTGRTGEWIFLVGVWGAMTTSMMGVWQGVPYMFSDFIGLMKGADDREQRRMTRSNSRWYRAWLFYLCLPPMIFFFYDKPVQVILLYALLSAVFMPFLAGTLLYMNSRRDWVGDEFRNGWISRGWLSLCLALFAWLAWRDVSTALSGLFSF